MTCGSGVAKGSGQEVHPSRQEPFPGPKGADFETRFLQAPPAMALPELLRLAECGSFHACSITKGSTTGSSSPREAATSPGLRSRRWGVTTAAALQRHNVVHVVLLDTDAQTSPCLPPTPRGGPLRAWRLTRPAPPPALVNALPRHTLLLSLSRSRHCPAPGERDCQICPSG